MQTASDVWRIIHLMQTASAFLSQERLFDHATRAAILKDYREVCLDTQLRIGGICNLELMVRHVIDNELNGAFVECGTWRGGSIAYWARSFIRSGGDQRRCRVYGFDSFEGMPRITVEDGEQGSKWVYGKPLNEVDASLLQGELTPTGQNVAPESVCRQLVESSGYLEESVRIVKGWFQHTIPEYESEIGPIAVLRLDADFYAATRFCLESLYENVLSNGAIIIDDYDCYGGCKRAVDEFISKMNLNVSFAFFGPGGAYFFKP